MYFLSPLCSVSPDCEQYIFQQVDISLPENKVWYDRYKYDIPVFHLNGQFLMMHRVNTSVLERQLEKEEDKLRHSIHV